MEWQTVIGLEVHAQLSTQSKIFSGAATVYGALPNTQACAIDLGFPGVLPVLNEKAVHYALILGMSINAEISHHSVFARKNYFYPDLPKGYQISQYELPIVGNGHLDISLENGETKRIGIIRAHLEEDAGKSLHEEAQGFTGIDLNRAGTPLIEIVSAPDMRSAKEAVSYLKTLHTLVRYLGICDGNMQEGSFRCDVNISLCPQGSNQFGIRAEIKNLNSFRYIEQAIAYEFERQKEILESGGRVIQETRLYDPDKGVTRSMRSKEEAHDYRYFPDPDLLPLVITDEMLNKAKQAIPELPWEKQTRFQTEYGLNEYDARWLSSDIDFSNYFETALKNCGEATPKMVANWITGDLSAALNKNNLTITECPITAEQLGKLLKRIGDQTISNNIGKQIFEAMWSGEGKGDADTIIEQKGLKQITDTSAIEKIIDEVMAKNPEQLAQYRSGKDKLFGYFVGQVMKAMGGKANPQQLNDLLKKKLG